MLIGHYKLDGDAQDSSGHGNHGTVYGATPTTGIIDGALLFDSQQEYVVLPDLSYSGDFPITLSVWAKANSTTQVDWSGIIGLKSGQATNTTLTISYHPAYGGLHLHTWSNSINTPYALDTNWHHYVAINTGNSEQKFYVDGTYIGSMYETLNIPAGRATIGIREYILARNDYWERTWNGVIDDVRIYDHILSNEDIKWLAEPKLLTKKQEDEINKQRILHYTFDKPPKSMENFVPAGERTCDQPFTRQGYHIQAYSYYQENGYTRIYINPTGDSPYVDWGFYAHKPGGSEVGDVYTISFKYKMIKNVSNTPYLQMAYQNGYKNPTHDHAATLEDEVHTPLKDGWVQYSRTVTITDAGNTWWRFGQRSDNAETEFYVDDFQVELGNSMTVFTNGEREGLAIDYTGNKHNAVLYPSTTPLWTSNNDIMGGGVFYFDEGERIEEFSLSSGLTNKYTVAAWIKPETAVDQRAPIVRIDRWYFQVFEDNKLATYWYGRTPSGYHYSNDNSINMNVWQHVCVVWTESDIKFYINGNLDTTINSVTGNGDLNSWIRVGFESNDRRYHGMIDDVRIYSEALSQSEIQYIYNQNLKASIDKNGNFWTKSLGESSIPLSIGNNQTKYENEGNSTVSIRSDGVYANKIIRY